MRRDWTSRLLLVALLGAFGAFAWLTRHPDAPILETAEGWPVVGPAAARFRALWLPATPPASREPFDDGPTIIFVEPDQEAIDRRAALEIESRDRVWVEEGVELRSEPDPAAPVLDRTRVIANLTVLERRGEWHRLRLGSLEGWARLEGRRDPDSPPLGSDPEPVMPLPGRPPDPELLAEGIALLGSGGRAVRAGSYAVHTDSRDALLERLARRVATRLEDLYRERYGLTPVGEPAEAVILFSQAADFHSFRRLADRRIPGWVLGFYSRGIVALHAEGWDAGAVAGTLAHELTHVLNRRALGPGLPPWLEEGLAEDLERLAAASLAGRPGSLGSPLLRSRLLEAAEAAGSVPELRALTALDEHDFHAAEMRLVHRELAGQWIRFLLADEEVGRGFRRYLGAVSRGAPLTPELLLGSLERSWDELEAGFRARVFQGAVKTAG